ncbi:MAG TPA: hypothetical protein VJU83_13085 [Burkholderiales bacterium]|nr:hypothetical protein [Burkholderiales bacterium]
MYIVAIAWLYIATLMALTAPSIVSGIATFFFYGLAPLTLFWWIVGGPARKRRRLMRMRMSEVAHQPDDENPGTDK